MAYNLPPPWDPGYAIPDNVRDEGLERRAYVTKWMPRGTYDQPKVGTGGYVVPQYVLDEGYGQGTFTTKWMPRGTYNGPRIPQWIQRQPTVAKQKSLGPRSVAVTFQRQGALSGDGVDEMGDPALPALYEEYGRRAAVSILSQINRVPPQLRKAQLKRIMDAVDPSLWRRTAEITRRYVARGLAATEAFHRGLARALSAGITAEVVMTGQSGEAPQARSLLGLGCYGCSAALGALGDTAPTTKCGNPIPGMSWAAATATVPAHWERARVGVAPTPNPTPGNYCVTPSGQVTSTPLAPHVTISDNQGPSVPPPGVKMLQVGPLVFPDNLDKPWIINANSPTQIPAAWKPFIVKALTTPQMIKVGSTWAGSSLAGVMAVPDNAIYKALGLVPGQKIVGKMLSAAASSGKWSDSADDAMPLATFTMSSGHKWGIYVAALPTKAAPTRLQMYVKWLPDHPWYADAFNWIIDLPVKVIDVAKAAVEELGALACKVATSPAAQQAGAAAGVAAGAGASVGSAGAAIVGGLCSQPTPPPVPFAPITADSGLLPLAILGGGALLAIILLKKKKKAAGP